MEGERETRSVTAIMGGIAAVTAIVAVWLVFQVWGLGRTPFHTKGEPREAVVIADIVQQQRWVLPRRNGVELPAKPPLFHWLGALESLRAGTIDERSVRLPSAVSSGAAALVVFATGAVALGVRPGFIAALALLSSFEWLRAATSARVDMTLALGLTLAFAGLLLFRLSERALYLPVVYAGATWAVLSKGPVGIALPALAILLMSVVDRSCAFVRRTRFWRGLLAVGLIAGLWYGLALAQGGRAFFAKQVLDENVYRFIGLPQLTGGHRHSAGYLALALLAGLLPWTLFLPSVAAALWRTRRTLSRRDPRLFAVLWIALVFAFYALAASKRGVYLLPMYPAVCLLLGWWADAVMRGQVRPRWLARPASGAAWALAALCAVASIAAGASAIGFPLLSTAAQFAGPRAAREITAALSSADPTALGLLLAAASTAGAFTALAAGAQRWGAMAVGLFLAFGAVVVAVRQVVLPAIAQEQSRQRFVDTVRTALAGPDGLYAYQQADYGMVFYWGRSLPVYREPLSTKSPGYLVMAESDWQRVAQPARQLYERVPAIESGRAANLGHLTLLRRVRSPSSPIAQPLAHHAQTEEGNP